MNTRPIIVDLWPKGAPHQNGLSGPEINQGGKVGHVSQARLLVYLPDPEVSWSAAVLIFPGGGFHALNLESMGTDLAVWLAERGIAGIVVKYRMPNGNPVITGEDALQAMLVAREHAEEWNIRRDKFGVCGYSIGGNTTAWLCNNAPDGVRPDFQMLFYPVISMKDDFTHVPSRENLMGKHPEADIIAEYSNEVHINEHVPPTFIALSDNDPVVSPAATAKYYVGLKKHKVPACMYIFPNGGHGWTIHSDFDYIEMCKELLFKWLKTQIPVI
ncbi:MAG: alpha/beta hydrolase [Bacteroidales bacterium]